ncbi:hypothetical protein [Eubacterium sp.]
MCEINISGIIELDHEMSEDFLENFLHFCEEYGYIVLEMAVIDNL